MSDANKRPDGCTMEGMIWNANAVLAKAVSSEHNGIPKNIFENCHGIIIISAVQVGLVFTNSVGSGIVMARDQATGKWSLPCACKLSGLGIGIILGGAHSDIIIFALNEAKMKEFARGNLFIVEEPMGADIGTFDRGGNLDLQAKKEGTLAVSFSKGAFVGLATHGANITLQVAANYRFYGREVSGTEILFGSFLKMPEGKITLIDEVYAKLNILSKGDTAVPDAAEKKKIEAAMEDAERAVKEAEKGDDVVRIDSLEAACSIPR